MTFTNDDTCKDNDKYKCTDAKSSKTLEFLNICLPMNKNALDAEEKAGYDALMKYIKDNTGALQDI